MEKLNVNTKPCYDILIRDGIFSDIPKLVLPFCSTKKVLIVTDDIVDKLYGDALLKNLVSSGFYCKKFVFENGEKSKNMDTLSDILEFAIKSDFHRNDLFLALGGGVVGDITGLASALFMRGADVIQVPTTLLSAVDSSVGGKTAVDLKCGKNSAGVFKQPRLVIIDTDIIKNLPEDIFEEGMGEVIKCGVIKELPIFDYINSGSVKENLDRVISDCLTLKKEIVEKDEFDTSGIRNILNVGHTVAHAIELLSEYSVPHGRAVAMGLVIEARIAAKYGICTEDTAKKIENAVRRQGLYSDNRFDKSEIAVACLKDKKNKDSKITFLLPSKIGSCMEVKLTLKELIDLL